MRLRHTIAAMLSLAVVACGTEPAPDLGSDPATETYAASLGVNIAQMTKVNNALYTQELVVGTGATAANGDTLQVTYTGWLVNGASFGSNVGGALLPLRLGLRDVIDGWDLGLAGIRVGGKRRLVIGSRLAFGSEQDCRGTTCIPARSTLIFDVQLVSKKP